MKTINNKDSNILNPQYYEWLQEYIDTDIIEITVLTKIHSLNDKASFDCIVYISNIINYESEFKIVYFEHFKQPTISKSFQNCFNKTTSQDNQLIINPRLFIHDWLYQAEANPFLIKFQINQNLNNQIPTKLGQADEIANFIKSKISQQNLESLYDETIKFINQCII
ncbi:unnamed protein product [Paramecium pentaurelia]|uniref:Uncharacterized protein n=1 Tax=Paramecium pentaurelia TaxID=43138 RepID=A0A8S1Y3J3_9CILI|nr:unnamed protein product [Paramecium pentaurelia]